MAVFRSGFTPTTVDNGGNATGAFLFTVAQSVRLTHVGFWKGNDSPGGTDPPVTIRPALWDETSMALWDAGLVDISAAPYSAWYDHPTGGIELSPGVNYSASVLVPSSAQLWYTTPAGYPLTDGVITSPANGGRFLSSSAFSKPASAWAGMHGVRIVYTLTVTQPVTPAVETDTAQALGRLKSCTLGLAVETDTAIPLGRLKTKAINPVTVTETAQPIGIVFPGLGLSAGIAHYRGPQRADHRAGPQRAEHYQPEPITYREG